MIYGFNDNKEKVEFKDAIIVHEIETTIASIPDHTSFAKYIPLSSYQIQGYQLIGFAGQKGGTGVILGDWNINSNTQELMLTFLNVTNSDRTDVTIEVKGLYVRVS
jgi:hypothetical protein